MRRLIGSTVLAVALAVASCTGESPPTTVESAATTTLPPSLATTEALPPTTTATPSTTSAASITTTTTTVTTTTTTLPPGVTEPPDWLGTNLLPVRPDGLGEIQPTPPELVDRRFTTPGNGLPPPDDDFMATIDPVPDDVLARSTWDPACPVEADDLRYLTVTFRGFDGRPHTGELLVAAEAAEPLVDVFEEIYAAGFPIEEMRITRKDELDAPPTGDGNVTTAFVCRPAVGSTSWSQHAYGLAVDINPFHNPYVRGDVVVPELASAYVDRSDVRPGMIVAGDAVTEAFAAIGWGWGGDWSSLVDTMHFSASGR